MQGIIDLADRIERELIELADEVDPGEPQRRTSEAIRRTLEYAGVEFTNGDAPGVKLRKR